MVTLVERLGRFGGAEHIALQIATRLDPQRFESTLVATRWTAELAAEPYAEEALEELRLSGVRFIGLPRRSTLDVWPWHGLVSVLRRGGVDVVHSHMLGSNVWGTVTGRLAQVPVLVAHEHSWSFEGQPLRQFLDREVIARFGDALIAVSEQDRRRMIAIERIPPAKAVFVPNGIPTVDETADLELSEALEIPDGVPVIGTVGTLRPEKRTELLIDAAVDLRAEFPDLHLLIVGGGAELDRLRAIVAERGLAEFVRLVGPRRDVPALLERMDVAVNTSWREGSPLSVMEYMDAGLAIVATSVGGVPDLIVDGEHGLLVEPDDRPPLTAAIARMLRDPASAQAMGKRARSRRREHFDVDVMVGRIERLYERLYAESTRGRGATSSLNTPSISSA